MDMPRAKMTRIRTLGTGAVEATDGTPAAVGGQSHQAGEAWHSARCLRTRKVLAVGLGLDSFFLETPVVKPDNIDADMTIDEIMRRWPATIRVLIRNRMLCIGCPIGIFHTVADACNAHRIDPQAFSQELLAAMRSDPSPNAHSAFTGGVAAL
jgi:hybrid cluster-associated redox disulfide protein